MFEYVLGIWKFPHKYLKDSGVYSNIYLNFNLELMFWVPVVVVIERTPVDWLFLDPYNLECRQIHLR